MLNLNSYKVTLDPTGQYTFKGVERGRIIVSLGIIPHWITNEERSFQEQVTESYGFPVYEMTGGTVDKDGNYVYPEDPVLAPLCKWERDGEVAYMYESAIMAFVKDGNTFITRVD